MIIVSLLLVIALERAVLRPAEWRIETYVQGYRRWLAGKNWLSADSEAPAVVLAILLPALLLWMLEALVLGSLLTFLLQTLILFMCLGCPGLRATYKCFLQAASRGDLEACSLYAEKLGHCEQEQQGEFQPVDNQGCTFGQQLIWLNYQHYAAVILFFIALGAPGAVLYCVAREFYHALVLDESGSELPAHPVTSTLLHALDFIPVRITALGFLLMGHFSRALPVWLEGAADTGVAARDFLIRVAAAAEMTSDEPATDISEEPMQLVKLAKRNILFLLVVTSLLTLTGNLA